MKVIYTFKVVPGIDLLGTDLLYNITRLSTHYSSKHYRTELYCDSESCKFFEHPDFKFNKINILHELDEYSGSIFSIPKMITCIHQKEPYIHLDFDAFIFRKLNLKADVTFGYYDADYSIYPITKHSEYVNNVYINTYEKYVKSKLPEEEYKDWQWKIFPNNSLLGVQNYRVVSQLYTYILQKFNSMIYEPDPDAHIAQFLEQYLLLTYLEFNSISFETIYKNNPINIAKQDILKKIKWFKYLHLQDFRIAGTHSNNLYNIFINELNF